MVRKDKRTRHLFLFVYSFNIFISDTMAAQPTQLVAAKCPTDELASTNYAIVNEKDFDPKRTR